MALLMGIMVAIGGSVGGSSGATVMLVIALIFNFMSYYNCDKMVLSMYGANVIERSDAPNLFDLVAKLAQKANLPMPRVAIINSQVPNAFATGRNPHHAVVAVTTGILETLSYEELSGVLAHELGHVKHRDILISSLAAMMATIISYIANIAQWAAIFGRSSDDDEGGGTLGFLFTVIVAPIAAMLIQLAISRAREYDADEEGGKICGNPNFLADGLEKIEAVAHHVTLPNAKPSTAHLFIVNPLSGAGQTLMSLFSTHPATEKRIARLRAQAQLMHL